MQVFSMSWTDLKALLSAKSIPYDVITRTDRIDVLASAGSGIIFESKIVIGTPDETDFNTNFLPNASLFGPQKIQISGYREQQQDKLRKSFKYVALAGQVNEFNEKFTEPVYLQGGDYKVDANASANGMDYFDFEVVDIDNILGYGANFVIKTFIEKEYVDPGEEEKMQEDDAALIPIGIYIRVRYVSTGASDVGLRIRYKLRR